MLVAPAKVRITFGLFPVRALGNRVCGSGIREERPHARFEPQRDSSAQARSLRRADAEDEADTRERVLGGEDAGDGDAEDIRRELSLEEDGVFS